MTCSAGPDLATAAAALCGRPVRALAPVRGGGNNRMYRVECDDGAAFALKTYSAIAEDPRDRLGTEFAALSFLAGAGCAVVPKPLARDPARGYALYEWIEGEAAEPCRDEEIEATLAFVADLHRLRAAPGADALAAASEACLRSAEIVRQVDARLEVLSAAAAEEPALAAFLNDRFRPARRLILERTAALGRETGLDMATELPAARLTLSPSDFGFHNALRRPGGRLVFVDFEYFGWDDPVRLVADFLQHPGMALSEAQRARFRAGASAIYGAGDPAFPARLDCLYPVVGLRWCMILLNEFLPSRRRRRAYAGQSEDWELVKARQLAKAGARLDAVSV